MKTNGQKPRQPTRIGVLGCGYWGPLLVRNFRSLAKCSLKTICDASEARLNHLRLLYPGVQSVRDDETLLSDRELDAVVIATPVKHHYAVIGALNDLPKPSAALRRIDSIGINRRSLEMVEFPAREMRTADLPFFSASRPMSE